VKHEDLCLVPVGAKVCTCEDIRRVRATDNPWADIMTTVAIEQEEHAREHGQTLAAARIEAESLGHSKECAAWIWADHGLPCDCGRGSGMTIKGELA
jgi:hypothetical protein